MSAPPQTLCALARSAIAAALRGERTCAHALPAPWDRPRGVFVTLRDGSGALRGCIGHLEPTLASLADEIAFCAQAAAFRDRRFAPLSAAELDDLSVEVSVLQPPEPIDSARQLDPARYGVLVSAGARRGVLLPDIPGIQDPWEQVTIACRKAGIDPDSDFALQRFEVAKVREAARYHA